MKTSSANVTPARAAGSGTSEVSVMPGLRIDFEADWSPGPLHTVVLPIKSARPTPAPRGTMRRQP